MAQRARCEICSRDFPSADALAMHNGAKHKIEEQPKKSNRKMWITIAIIAAIIILGYFLISGKSTSGDAINNPSYSAEIQKITLSFNGNYFPNTIKVKEGIPVEITLDDSIGGCYRSFNIPELKVSKSSSSPADTIKFTPSQKGTFGFRCGMGMGTGTIIVE